MGQGFWRVGGTGVIAAAAMAVVGAGCGGENGGGTQVAGPQELVAQGWDRFEAGEYQAAWTNFEAAKSASPELADAWNGAGWSAGRLPAQFNQAETNFSRAYALDTTRYDALGGWAFAAFEKGDWAGALNKADSLLQRRAGWRFLHDPAVDYRDLHLLRARCFFNQGDFGASLEAVRTYLNPDFEADVGTPWGRAELVRELERLGQIYG